MLDLQNSEEGQRRRGSYNVHHYDRNEWELKHTIKVSQVLSLPWRLKYILESMFKGCVNLRPFVALKKTNKKVEIT